MLLTHYGEFLAKGQNFIASIITTQVNFIITFHNTCSSFQSDGTGNGKGSRDEIGVTLNDFQRKTSSGVGGHYVGGERGRNDTEGHQSNGHELNQDTARSQDNR